MTFYLSSLKLFHGINWLVASSRRSVWRLRSDLLIFNDILLRVARGARNPNLQVDITHALHICHQLLFGLPLRINWMLRTQFDHARLDLQTLVIWSRVFWPSVGGSPIGFSGCGICLISRPGFGILKQNWERFGIEVCTGCGMPKIAIGITGLRENLVRFDGIEVPYWGPSWSKSVLTFDRCCSHSVTFDYY